MLLEVLLYECYFMKMLFCLCLLLFISSVFIWEEALNKVVKHMFNRYKIMHKNDIQDRLVILQIDSCICQKLRSKISCIAKVQDPRSRESHAIAKHQDPKSQDPFARQNCRIQDPPKKSENVGSKIPEDPSAK